MARAYTFFNGRTQLLVLNILANKSAFLLQGMFGEISFQRQYSLDVLQPEVEFAGFTQVST